MWLVWGTTFFSCIVTHASLQRHRSLWRCHGRPMPPPPVALRGWWTDRRHWGSTLAPQRRLWSSTLVMQTACYRWVYQTNFESGYLTLKWLLMLWFVYLFFFIGDHFKKFLPRLWWGALSSCLSPVDHDRSRLQTPGPCSYTTDLTEVSKSN